MSDLGGHRPDTNPFTPDFGQAPPVMVGRDGVMEALLTSWATGPRDSGFTSLLLGPRGTGKTALMGALAETARRSGWIIISVKANTRGLPDRIAEELDAIDRMLQSEGQRGRITGVQVMGIGAQWAPSPDAKPQPIRHRLARLADHAAEHDAGVLLEVDEVHGSNPEEMRGLCSDVQQITKEDGRSLAFLAAGLGDFQYRIMSDQKMTFLQRCAWQEIGSLAPEDVVRGLRIPIEDAGGQIDHDALESAADAAPMLPFHMQMVGRKAWQMAPAPRRPVSRWAVAEALRQSETEMERRVYEPVWGGLPESCQTMLAVLADEGGACDRHVLAQRLGMNRKAFSGTVRRLEAGGHLNQDGNTVSGTGLIPQRAIRQMAHRDLTDNGTAESGAGGQGDSPQDRCGKPMQRVPGRCVLTEGHAGGCRSRL